MAQFQQAAQQIEAEDIADVLQVQAADAEDATEAEEEPDTETNAAEKAQAAAGRQGLVKDAAARLADSKSAPKTVTADGVAADGMTHPVIDAAGVTKDVHESDLDLTHADSAPGVLVLSQAGSHAAIKQAKPQDHYSACVVPFAHT